MFLASLRKTNGKLPTRGKNKVRQKTFDENDRSHLASELKSNVTSIERCVGEDVLEVVLPNDVTDKTAIFRGFKCSTVY